MKLRRLRNDYLKNRCDVNKKAYDAQRNLCVSLARKAKFDHSTVWGSLSLRLWYWWSNYKIQKKIWKPSEYSTN